MVVKIMIRSFILDLKGTDVFKTRNRPRTPLEKSETPPWQTRTPPEQPWMKFIINELGFVRLKLNLGDLWLTNDKF